jgi:two-component system response regulator (stage 0 sporulation protein F)
MVRAVSFRATGPPTLEGTMTQILIVEDEAATAWALQEGLSEEGYAIVAVDTAEKALAAVRQSRPDVVITDLRLPRMDGLELVRRLAARKHAAPVIVVTAYGARDVLEQLAALGIHACFSKPFQVDQLRRSVKAALREKAA